MARDPELPGALTALRRAMGLAYRAQPALLVVSFSIVALSWVPDALGALWLKFMADGVLHHHPNTVRVAAAGLAVSVTAGWLLRTIGGRIEMVFRERATVVIESHVAHLQASVSGIEHHERPEYLDRLQLIRDQAFLLNHLYASFFDTFGSSIRLVLTIGLLVSVHPALFGLALFAVPTVWVASRRAAIERRTEEAASPYKRAARHFFELGTFAGPGKEVRVSGVGDRVVGWRRDAWEGWYRDVSRARARSAAANAGAWSLFGLAFIGAVVFVASGLHRDTGDVLLVLAAGANLSRFLGVTVGQAEFLRWTIDAAKRLFWLEAYATAHVDAADVDAPERLRHGITLDKVSFSYPGTDKLVLRDVDLMLPAGGVVAVVGENGAGKTTLVKLLARMYAPTGGTITVDGADLSHIAAESWRSRMAGAFQDFFRFEFLLRETVGLGDVARIDDRAAVGTAVTRGGAGDVVERLPGGIDTQLGPTWHEGVDLSFGQWQKLALARGLMRDRPLLVVLDEPTAALDAETEHALFERFASASRADDGSGRITLLVSHRFSTVRMADLIVVIDGNRVTECGSHEELMALGGTYAELYDIQASAYRR
jgi:ATP-binding cassette, subfamily B, bacterial